MKKLLFITLCLSFLSFRGFGNDQLTKAQKAYDTKKYKEAIEAYQKLIKDGYKSYQLYFNLGNAYYRNNELGRAIYYYELARKVEPNDEDIRINLGIASSKTIDKIDSKENFFISAVKTNLLSSLSTSAWAWLSIFCISFAAILFFVFVNSEMILLKRIAFLASSILVVAFLISYFLGYSALKDRYENKFAIILTNEIKILNEPTLTAKSKFILHEGTKIRVIENNGDWLLIKLDNGNEGWVKLTDVGII
jgi:tetratricopeptide (TPR) repeat protein